MPYIFAADTLVLLHLTFIIFVIAGGLMVIRWRWLALLHIPAVTWGALLELNGWLCPLTPLENSLRHRAGDEGYSGGFIEHYIVPLIYPADLTHEIQITLGITVIVVNLFIYAFVLYRSIRKTRKT